MQLMAQNSVVLMFRF